MTHDHVNITLGQSYNVEQARGDARVFQGQANAPVDVRASNSAERGKTSTGDLTNAEQQRKDQDTTPSTASQTEEWNQRLHDEDASALQRKLAELARNAVTIQVDPHTGDPYEPIQAHYGDNDSYNFKSGELYRIWHRTNTEIHLSTFLIVGKTGTNMACLKIVHCDPYDEDHRFRKVHGKIRVEQDTPVLHLRGQERAERASRSYGVVMHRSQRLRDDCWVELRNSWTINWQKEYVFVFCGSFLEESLEEIREAHLDHYVKSLQGA